ncbi:MAG: DUF819 family protein [Bacteroidota bacterium]
MFAIFLQISTLLLLPFVCIKVTRALGVDRWLSPVVCCYAIGILLANFHPFALSASITDVAVQGTVLLAIPLLLYTTDIVGWLRYARTTLLSFGLCVLSGIIVSLLMAYLFADMIDESWQLSGMLVGIFTGGMANMQAIGMALGVDRSLFVLVNAGDIFAGGLYLILLTSIMHPLLGYILPSFHLPTDTGKDKIQQSKPNERVRVEDMWRAIVLTLAIVGVSAALTYLIAGTVQQVSLLILLLTSSSVLASFSKKVRAWKGTFASGEYLLLIFCVAIGMQANLQDILTQGTTVICYTTGVLFGTAILHLLFCYLCRIDRDTAMITATAAIYGPVFIGQIASAIRNRTLVFSGMATGLVGYAIGNYLGIGIGNLLRWWLH